MGYQDLHEKPFDKGTIAKLEIFEDYAQAWIPTFVMLGAPEIHIFDFFSGPGYDSKEVAGSPIRIMQKIEEQLGNILVKKTKVVLHFNEFEPNKKKQEKFEALQENCSRFAGKNPKFKYFLTVNYYNEDAEELFFKLLPLIQKFPSLVYLDQNGVKFISEEYINALEKTNTTDFIYFVSSSYFKWLGGTEEFKRVLDFDKSELEKEEYRNIHRLVLNKLKSKISASSRLKLFPFSIKKATNIYGIIFGAKSYAAVDKFLKIAWDRNATNGEADFDIDEDASKVQLNMFSDKKLTKIEKFQNDLEQKLLNRELPTNKDVLLYSYSCGHIHPHAEKVVKKLKVDGRLTFDGKTPALNYENVFRKENIVHYKIK
jgi:three-Cys-motif partner protein